VARTVDYETVSETLLAQGLKSLYYNSGSFGFAAGVPTRTVAWIGPPDPTIRPEAAPFTRGVPAPFEDNLTRLALRAWQEILPGVLWATPRSHWAYELDYGSREWMPDALAAAGVGPASMAPLTHGAAIEFAPDEREPFATLLRDLLAHLSGSSDFQLSWPGRPVVCTVHHHKQLWWTTSDDALYARLDALAPA
jgi:hypothetical protein